MQKFFIEGIIAARKGAKKGRPEPVTLAVWANSREEALTEARRAAGAVDWVEGPRIGQSEEQRMRAMGAPELFNYEETNNPSRGDRKR